MLVVVVVCVLSSYLGVMMHVQLWQCARREATRMQKDFTIDVDCGLGNKY